MHMHQQRIPLNARVCRSTGCKAPNPSIAHLVIVTAVVKAVAGIALAGCSLAAALLLRALLLHSP